MIDLNTTESKMQKSLESLKTDLSKVRTGRASPTLVDSLRVDYYGTATPLGQMAQISIPDPKTLQISCWDQSAIPLVEKAIVAANLGLTPNVDGKIIRINVPPLTEDRRKDITKSVKKMGEDSKIALRNIRRESNDSVKADEKAKTLGEDESKKHQEAIQKATDKYVKEVEVIVENKCKDILSI